MNNQYRNGLASALGAGERSGGERLRRVAKGRVDTRPASAATLTQTAAGTEKFMDNLFFVWPASAARGGSKKAVKEVVKSTIRYLNPEEDKKLLEQK